MAFLKQLLVTLVVIIVGLGLWISLDARAGAYVLNAGLPLPGPVRDLIASLSPEPVEERAGATPVGRGGRGGSARPTIVVADTVDMSVTRNRMRAIGTGEAERSVSVYPDVTGIIETVPFKSGDRVAVGDTLADLENDAEELAVDRARIAVAAAEEKLARVERLEASRSITAVEVTSAGRELENARLDLRAAEIALAKRRIVAPIAGRVGIVSVDTGDLVNNTTLITTIDDRSRLKVNFYTPETFVQELAIGQPIEAVSTARPEKTYQGVISAIDSRLDEASRTLRTEATIDNPEDELRPGMSFAMTLSLEGERLLSVDPLSVQWERNGPVVWKIEGDVATKRAVRIVERNIDRVLVTSETLKEGDTVAVEGVQALREGAKVQIQNAPKAAPDEAPSAEGTPRTPAGSAGAGAPASAEAAEADRRRAATTPPADGATPPAAAAGTRVQ